MTGSELIGLVMIASFAWLLAKWRRWSKRVLADRSGGVSRNSGRKRKVYEQDRPFAECFDDNDTAWDAEMGEDL